MADNDQKNGEAAESDSQPQFALQRIYIKDLSFESPRAPKVFQEEWKPEVQMDINTGANKLGDDVYEVVLSVTITVKCKEETVYLVEVHQAGVFAVSGIQKPELEQALGAYGPNILFPYVRETVDNLMLKGSFPPMHLAPVNFDVIFAQAMQQRAEQQASTENTTTH